MKKRGTIITVSGVRKTFRVGLQDIEVLKGIDLEIKYGDFAIILGPSGCGKSTLLHSILGLEKPTEGKVIIEDKDIYSLSDDDIVRYRKGRVGIVFQQPIWIKSLNVLENVCVPSRLLGLTESGGGKSNRETENCGAGRVDEISPVRIIFRATTES